MKIKNLKINGFGKLENKEINLKDGINVIYGENESGKSTLLKFIISMFYGLSKNKNGGSIPEMEKYEPWKSQEFSGKISYELDNYETYEVYRDFKKKNPKVFNKNLEDVSKEFNIDKTKGNQFFYDQIGVEEEIFVSSIVSKQAEVKLEEKEQNSLIQKISNILGTGEDNTSYSSVVNKLKKKINDEVGTPNTKERPINLVENKLNDLILQKESLIEYKESKSSIDEIIKEKQEKIANLENELEKLKSVNTKKDELIEQESRIKIGKEITQRIQEEINNLEEQKNKFNIQTLKKPFKIRTILLIVFLILSVSCAIAVPSIIFKILVPILTALYTIYFIVAYTKQKKNIYENEKNIRDFTEKIVSLEKDKEEQLKTIEKIQTEYNKKIDKIKLENNISDIKNVVNLIEEKQSELNRANANLYEIQIDNKNASEKLERLVNIEEEIKDLQEEKEELETKGENIRRTIKYLEIAYNKMKEQITPKFTEELSYAMEKISNGKYKNVRINTEGRIIVETKIGEYIDAENLSIGTIDQLYLSLRIAAIKEITKENMPIILDEAFAYYDENRLENILKFLSEEYKEKQVIIFTCTKRETETLNKLNLMYNLIELINSNLSV